MTTAFELYHPLTIVDGPRAEAETLVRYIGKLADVRGHLAILEAGCGTAWPLDLGDIRYILTGIDLNAAALAIRLEQQQDLDQGIVGDLRTVEVGDASYDVIYNSFVLEHIAGARDVLDNFACWLRPGGLLILRIPDPRSAYGFLSRQLPFWCHVLYKRHVAGMKNAGKPGHDPFPTVYDAIVSREGIHAWCRKQGFAIRLEAGWTYQIARPGLMSRTASFVLRLVTMFSAGTLTTDHVNLTYVIENGQPEKLPSHDDGLASRTAVGSDNQIVEHSR